jgi:hypothetical protein
MVVQLRSQDFAELSGCFLMNAKGRVGRRALNNSPDTAIGVLKKSIGRFYFFRAGLRPDELFAFAFALGSVLSW